MHRLHPLIATCCCLMFVSFLTGLAQESPAPAKEPAWITIFDGKTLNGWQPKFKGHDLGEIPLETVRVEDGMMRIDYANYDEFKGRFGHIFYKTPYANYRFRCDYRFTGEQAKGGPGWAYRNSGIMTHCQDPTSMRKDQDFPVSIEVQLLDGAGRPTGNLCTPGTHVQMHGKLHRQHCTNSSSKKYDGEEWVTAEVEVLGNRRVRHYIDGVLVLEYERPQLDPNDRDAKQLIAQREGEVMLGQGWIALQAESHPVDFRNIQIMPLPDGDEE